MPRNMEDSNRNANEEGGNEESRRPQSSGECKILGTIM
jgi:hypothetical protein